MLVEQCMKSSGKTIYNYIPKFAKLIELKLWMFLNNLVKKTRFFRRNE